MYFQFIAPIYNQLRSIHTQHRLAEREERGFVQFAPAANKLRQTTDKETLTISVLQITQFPFDFSHGRTCEKYLQAVRGKMCEMKDFHLDEYHKLQDDPIRLPHQVCHQLILHFASHINSNGNSIFTVMMGGRWFSSTLGDNPSVARVEELAVEHLKRIIRCDKTPVR